MAMRRWSTPRLATKGLPRAEMAGKPTILRVAMRQGKRRVLPDSRDRRLADMIKTADAHIRAKGVPLFRIIEQQFGFVKTRRREKAKNRCQGIVLAAPTSLFLARSLLLTPI